MEKEFDPNREGDFNRDDSSAEKKTTRTKSTESEASSPFVRDKRPRIRRVTETLNERKPREAAAPEDRAPEEKTVRRTYTREPRDEQPEQPAENRRRSYNPNFDENNRPVSPRPRPRYEENPEEDRRFNSYGYDRNQSSRSDSRPQRSNQPYRRDDRSGEQPYRRDDRSMDQRPRYNRDDRPEGQRNDRYGRDDRPRSNKPYQNDRGGKPSYGDRKPRPGQDRYDRTDNRRPADPFKTPKGGYDSSFKPKVYPAYAAAKIDEPIRLNKYISMSGLCSRREADEYIKAGDITVNGEVVTELGVKINPTDEIRYKGDQLQGEKRIYILMNKPKGFVTTVEDPNADRTVMDIVKNACQERVYPVGRLDKNSLGVLLITNDGELTKKLTHPSNEKKKVYQVALDRPATIDDLQKLYEGVQLDDGIAVADEVDFLDESKREIGISLHTGRNRIVRRMFEELGYHVQKLDRVYFAGLTKKGLRRGAWRYLTPKEVAMLKTGGYE